MVLKSEKPVPNIAFFEHLARNQLRNVDDVKEEKKHHDHRQVNIFSNCEVNIAIPEYQRVGKPDYQSKRLESGVSVHPHIEKQAEYKHVEERIGNEEQHLALNLCKCRNFPSLSCL